jgi:4-amino-4-deoxy-L-arabinose transferase-like glycosyltransferase
LLDVATAYLVFLIASHVFKHRGVGLVAMVAFAVYVPEIVYTTRAYSEPIGTFLLACFVFALLKALQRLTPLWFAAAGISLGLSILTRPVMLAFSAVALIVLATWPALRGSFRKLLASAFAFTVGVAVTMMPWIVRNYVTFQAFIPASTLGGYNLYLDHWRLDETDYNNPSRWADNYWKFIDPESKAELVAQGVQFVEWDGREFPNWNEYEFDRFYYEKALMLIRQYPLRYLHLSVLRVAILWFNVGYGAPPSIQSYLVMATNLLFLALAAVAYLFYGGAWRKEAAPLVWLVIYTTVAHALMRAGYALYIDSSLV